MRRKQAKDIKYLVFSLIRRLLQVKLRRTEHRRVIAVGPVGIGWGSGGHDGEMVLKGTTQTPNARCIDSRDLTYISDYH